MPNEDLSHDLASGSDITLCNKIDFLTLRNHVHDSVAQKMAKSWMFPYQKCNIRLQAKKGPAPPLGNFADISYLEENFKPSFKRCLHSVLRGVSL